MNLKCLTLVSLALTLWFSWPLSASGDGGRVLGDAGSGSSSVTFEDSFGVWTAHVTCDAFSDDNPDNPSPLADHYTYVYTLTNDAGSSVALQEFRASFAEDATIVEVDFIDDGDVAPSSPPGPTGGNEVQWEFMGPTIAPGQASGRLLMVSDFLPGSNTVSAVGTFGSGAGSCLGPAEPPPPPGEIELPSTRDSFLRGSNVHKNEGANVIMRVNASVNNRAIIDFDLSELPDRPLSQATLVLTVHPGKTPADWGATGRTVDAHRLTVEWAEGNGKHLDLPTSQKTRGTLPGTTWKCPIDTVITNTKADCPVKWLGGTFAPATAPGVVHFNGMSGAVSWDVTQDIQDVLSGEPFFGFLVKKTNEAQSGRVRYYSKEGAAEAMDPFLAPQLILEFD